MSDSTMSSPHTPSGSSDSGGVYDRLDNPKQAEIAAFSIWFTFLEGQEFSPLTAADIAAIRAANPEFNADDISELVRSAAKRVEIQRKALALKREWESPASRLEREARGDATTWGQHFHDLVFNTHRREWAAALVEWELAMATCDARRPLDMSGRLCILAHPDLEYRRISWGPEDHPAFVRRALAATSPRTGSPFVIATRQLAGGLCVATMLCKESICINPMHALVESRLTADSRDRCLATFVKMKKMDGTDQLLVACPHRPVCLTKQPIAACDESRRFNPHDVGQQIAMEMAKAHGG